MINEENARIIKFKYVIFFRCLKMCIRDRAKQYEAQIEELYTQIGKLTAQYEWMKKKSGI